MSLDIITASADTDEPQQPSQQPPSTPPPTIDDTAAPLPLHQDGADDPPLPAARAIAAIDAASVHRICSGQVILDLATAVKELIENALDAHATHVHITLRAHGAELLEVSDNGSGIDEADYPNIARKHHTSKLRHFSDLSTVTSYGFRGEALSSLCALASLSLSTKTATQQLGTLLSFDHDGRLVSQRPIARTQGTTVTLTGLFTTLPVRYKSFIKSVKREYARMLSVVQAYGLMAAGVRLTVSQHSKQGGKSTVFATQGTHRLLDAITNVFGGQQANKVQQVDALLVGDEEQPFNGSSGSGTAAGVECRVRGWVSNGRDGRTSNDRQYIYINQRPVDLPKLTRLLNDAFRTFSSSPTSASYPFLLLDLQLPTDCYDVNVTPNKRTVLLHEESGLMAAVRRVLVDVWAPSQQTFAINHRLDSYMTTVKREMTTSRAEQVSATAAGDNDIPASLPSLEQVDDDDMQAVQQPPLLSTPARTSIVNRSSVDVQKEATARRTVANGGVEVKKEAVGRAQPDSSTSQSSPPLASSTPHSAFTSTLPTSLSSPMKRQKVSRTSSVQPHRPPTRPVLPSIQGTTEEGAAAAGRKQRKKDDWTITGGRYHTPQLSSHSSPARPDSREDSGSKARVKHEEEGDDERNVVNEEVEVDDTPLPPPAPARTTVGMVHVDISAITRYWRIKGAASSPTLPTSSTATTSALHDRLTTASASSPPLFTPPADDNCCSSDLGGHSSSSTHLLTPSQLTRVVSKIDFTTMRVIGQFNLGFIIALLGTSDLFIIDQHAADEKFRYERLCRLTHIQRQPLLTPLSLQLSPAQSALLVDHLSLFTAHGFSFHWSAGREGEGVVDGLVGLPWSRDKQFGVSDVHELLELVSDGRHVRGPVVLPKLLSVFASRACRSAVMVGDALDEASMSVIVRHMSEMEHPWACPHGRPTMRHLCDISLIAAT